MHWEYFVVAEGRLSTSFACPSCGHRSGATIRVAAGGIAKTYGLLPRASGGALARTRSTEGLHRVADRIMALAKCPACGRQDGEAIRTFDRRRNVALATCALFNLVALAILGAGIHARSAALAVTAGMLVLGTTLGLVLVPLSLASFRRRALDSIEWSALAAAARG